MSAFDSTMDVQKYGEPQAKSSPATNGLSTRLATDKDLEAIWNFYLETNFLYAEKLAAMQDNGAKAKDTLHKLLSLKSEVFQLCVCENDSSELLSVCTHSLYSAAQNHVMHLASNGDIKAVIKIFKASHEITFNSSADFITFTFRPNNSGVKRLLVSVLTDVKEDFENETYDYYKFSTSDLTAFKAKTNAFQVDEAIEVDRLHLLQKLEDATQRIVLSSIGRLDDITISGVSDAFNSVGLSRQRKAFSLKIEGIIEGMAFVEIGPDWWNLSGLGTGIRLFFNNPEERIVEKLLATACDWLSGFQVSCWTMIVSPQQKSLTRILNKLGFTSQKQYQRITFQKSLSNTHFIYNNYLGFIERKKTTNNDLYNGV